jgi:UDPglucose 6-dehydrogenase
VVLGASDREAAESVARLYLSLQCPIIITDLRTAEMIKYASNAFLATKISFINEMAGICERLGANVEEVALGMGYDGRIGSAFLNAGLGFGGSCFPKDVRALMRMAQDADLHPQLLEAVMEINADRRRWVIQQLTNHLGSLAGRRIGLLGLAFKPNTDDVREAASLTIIEQLQDAGAQVAAYDPAACATAAAVTRDVSFCADAYAVAEGADALVLVTEWNEFRDLDLPRLKGAMRGSLLVDGRNLYQTEELAALGFSYVGVARGPHPVVAALPQQSVLSE